MSYVPNLRIRIETKQFAGRKARTEDSPDEDDDEINSKKVKSEVDEAGQTEEPLGDDDFN